MAETKPPISLTYAHRRGVRAGRYVALALLLALAGAAFWARRPIERRWRAYRIHQSHEQCLHGRAPQGQVVYEEDPTRAGALLAEADTLAWTRPRDPQHPCAGRTYRPWSALNSYVPPWSGSAAGGKVTQASSMQRPIVFVGERTFQTGLDAAGNAYKRPQRRLVVIELDRETRPDGSDVIVFWFHIFEADLGPTGLVWINSIRDLRGPGAAIHICRVYAGQPDPQNPADVRIDYEVNGAKGSMIVTVIGRRPQGGTHPAVGPNGLPYMHPEGFSIRESWPHLHAQ